MKAKRILATGAGGAATSNFIKSLRLANENYYVVGIDNNKFHLDLSQADTNYLIPPCNSPLYIKEINKIIEKEKIDFVHPQPDPEVKAISNNRALIKTKTFLPRKETVDICQDKWLTYQKLSSGETFVPLSFLIKTGSDLKKASKILLRQQDKFWIRARSGAGAKASLPVDNIRLAIEWISFWKRKDKNVEFIASEFLTGTEYAFQSLWLDGQLVVSQARERIEYLFGYLTASGQTSSPALAKTVSNDLVNEIATAAVLSVDKHASGVFCVDLKTNYKNAPCVTEINAGRFFTTSNFITEAGCNMPDMYIKMAFNNLKNSFPKYNAVPPNYYWVRMMDMGSKIIKNVPSETKIVIFDFDNTIALLNVDWEKIRNDIKSYLKKINYKHNFQSIGSDLNSIYKEMTVKNNKMNIRKFRKDVNDIIKKEELKAVDKAIMDPDFFKLLKILKSNNIKTAILSDNSEIVIKKILSKISKNTPDYLVGRETSKYFKPDTTGLEQILKKSMRTKNEVLYVGDSKKDADLASRSGINAVLVQNFTGAKINSQSNLFKEISKYINI